MSHPIQPEYIHFEGEAVWLDEALFDVDSRKVRELLRTSEKTAVTGIDELLALYEDRFALDFAYEDWAASYRDSLHVSLLAAAERAVRELAGSGQIERAIGVCRRALELDPNADALELTLLRLYRQSNAQAAVAEQYAHYSAVLRQELGVEPPPFEDLLRTDADT